MEHSNVTGKRFFAVTLLNILITVVEFIGGIVSGSLGLLSDGVHNLEDSLSVIISYVSKNFDGIQYFRIDCFDLYHVGPQHDSGIRSNFD